MNVVENLLHNFKDLVTKICTLVIGGLSSTQIDISGELF